MIVLMMDEDEHCRYHDRVYTSLDSEQLSNLYDLLWFLVVDANTVFLLLFGSIGGVGGGGWGGRNGMVVEEREEVRC